MSSDSSQFMTAAHVIWNAMNRIRNLFQLAGKNVELKINGDVHDFPDLSHISHTD